MDPLLPRRCRFGLPFVIGDSVRDDEATDALRRRVRFVCTSATRVGVMGCARRAAAAAAADNVELGSWRLKTAAAAVAAFGSTVAAVKGCTMKGMSAWDSRSSRYHRASFDQIAWQEPLGAHNRYFLNNKAISMAS